MAVVSAKHHIVAAFCAFRVGKPRHVPSLDSLMPQKQDRKGRVIFAEAFFSGPESAQGIHVTAMNTWNHQGILEILNKITSNCRKNRPFIKAVRQGVLSGIPLRQVHSHSHRIDKTLVVLAYLKVCGCVKIGIHMQSRPVQRIVDEIVPVPMFSVSACKDSRLVVIQGIRILGGHPHRSKGCKQEPEIVQGRLHPYRTDAFFFGCRIGQFKYRIVYLVVCRIEFLFWLCGEFPYFAYIFFVDGGPQVFWSVSVPHPQDYLAIVLRAVIIGKGPQRNYGIKAHHATPLHVVFGPAAVITPVVFPVLPPAKRGQCKKGNQQQKKQVLIPDSTGSSVGQNRKQQPHRSRNSSLSPGLEHAQEQSCNAIENNKSIKTTAGKAPFLEPRQEQQVPSRNKNHVGRNTVFNLGRHHPPEGKGNDGSIGVALFILRRRFF